MRYSKDHKAETHMRIVEKASERFRTEGVDNVGVASLMQSVGLTVGGFYAHFESKEALIAEACRLGFSGTTALFESYLETKRPGRRLEALVDAYLSPQHRDEPGAGCMVAANGAEIARHAAPTRDAFASQIDAWIAVIARTMSQDGLEGDARGVAATLVGSLVLARAINDRAQSDAFLESGRKAAMAGVRPRKT